MLGSNSIREDNPQLKYLYQKTQHLANLVTDKQND